MQEINFTKQKQDFFNAEEKQKHRKKLFEIYRLLSSEMKYISNEFLQTFYSNFDPTNYQKVIDFCESLENASFTPDEIQTYSEKYNILDKILMFRFENCHDLKTLFCICRLISFHIHISHDLTLKLIKKDLLLKLTLIISKENYNSSIFEEILLIIGNIINDSLETELILSTFQISSFINYSLIKNSNWIISSPNIINKVIWLIKSTTIQNFWNDCDYLFDFLLICFFSNTDKKKAIIKCLAKLISSYNFSNTIQINDFILHVIRLSNIEIKGLEKSYLIFFTEIAKKRLNVFSYQISKFLQKYYSVNNCGFYSTSLLYALILNESDHVVIHHILTEEILIAFCGKCKQKNGTKAFFEICVKVLNIIVLKVNDEVFLKYFYLSMIGYKGIRLIWLNIFPIVSVQSKIELLCFVVNFLKFTIVLSKKIPDENILKVIHEIVELQFEENEEMYLQARNLAKFVSIERIKWEAKKLKFIDENEEEMFNI